MEDTEKYKKIREQWQVENNRLAKLMLKKTRDEDSENQVRKSQINRAEAALGLATATLTAFDKKAAAEAKAAEDEAAAAALAAGTPVTEKRQMWHSTGPSGSVAHTRLSRSGIPTTSFHGGKRKRRHKTKKYKKKKSKSRKTRTRKRKSRKYKRKR